MAPVAKPLLDLAEQGPPVSALVYRVLLKRHDRIFEHRHHQKLERADRAIIAPVGEKLIRCDDIGRK